MSLNYGAISPIAPFILARSWQAIAQLLRAPHKALAHRRRRSAHLYWSAEWVLQGNKTAFLKDY
jgi:hypothetical protein